MVDGIKKTLMVRDGLSEAEAEAEISMATADMDEAIMNAGSLEDLEDLLMDDLGLDPDYLFEMLERLV